MKKKRFSLSINPTICRKISVFLLLFSIFSLTFFSLQLNETLLQDPSQRGLPADPRRQIDGGEQFIGNDSMENQPPVAVIDTLSPTHAKPGEPVTFIGHGEDSDGRIIGWTWSSTIDDLLSRDASFTTSTLSIGRHTISFIVTDNIGIASPPTTALLVINNPPHASAGNGAYFGYVNTPLVFDGSKSFDDDGSLVSWNWSFGDGTTSGECMPTHTYTAVGQYTIHLVVTDDLGESDMSTTTATIVSSSPIAYMNGPYHGLVNATLSFNGSNSMDLDGVIVAWSWDFGDGTLGTGVIMTHIYQTEGTYPVLLEVTDNDGKIGRSTTVVVITISNIPPNKPCLVLKEASEGNTTVTVTLQSDDPNQDQIIYFIDWDDATTTTLPLCASGTTSTTSHTWNTPGRYTVHATAIDEHHVVSEITDLIIIVGSAPFNTQESSQENTMIALGGIFLGIVAVLLIIVVLFLRYRQKKRYSHQ